MVKYAEERPGTNALRHIRLDHASVIITILDVIDL